MTDTDTAELVAAFRAYIAACSGPGTTLYDGHPAVLMSKGIEQLTALERERDEARARLEKHSDYSIQLQRIIEAVCHGNDLREDSAELFHHKMVLHLIPNYKDFEREPAP